MSTKRRTSNPRCCAGQGPPSGRDTKEGPTKAKQKSHKCRPPLAHSSSTSCRVRRKENAKCSCKDRGTTIKTPAELRRDSSLRRVFAPPPGAPRKRRTSAQSPPAPSPQGPFVVLSLSKGVLQLSKARFLTLRKDFRCFRTPRLPAPTAAGLSFSESLLFLATEGRNFSGTGSDDAERI